MNRAARGLTLIEVVVSMFILTLVLMGFMAATSATAAQRTLAEEDFVAEQVLSDLLEELRARSTPELLTGTGWVLPATDALHNAEVRLVLVHDEVGAMGTSAAALEIVGAGALTATAVTDAGQLERLRLTGGLDLNADGDVEDGILPITSEEEQAAVRLLPALLQISWRSVAGTRRSLEIHAYLTDY